MAERNRTVTITEDEAKELDEYIASIDDIKGGIKDNSVINADIYEALDFMPNEYFDLIIIDPPYNLDKDFNGNKFNKMNDSSYEEYLRSWFYKVCDKLKPNGSLYMCGDWKCTSSMQKVIAEKLVVLNRITWQREKGRGAKTNWKNSMEDIWFAVKNPNDYYFDVESVKLKRKVLAPYKVDGKPKDWVVNEDGNYRMTYPSNFWDDITVPFWSMPENTEHPTQKPEKLYAKLILASSKVGDTIFDPFLGSGTAAVVANKLNRRFIGVEIDRKYCQLAVKRLLKSENDKTIQGYCDGVFLERNTQK